MPHAAVPALLGDLLTGIDHVGVATDDLDGALAWWAGLGLVEEHRETNDQQGVLEVMLTAGPVAGVGVTRVQLLLPTAAEAAVARFLHRRGPGLHHLAFAVTDLAAACERLAAAGVPLLYAEPRAGTAGSKINFVHPRQAGGVLVELVEPA